MYVVQVRSTHATPSYSTLICVVDGDDRNIYCRTIDGSTTLKVGEEGVEDFTAVEGGWNDAAFGVQCFAV